MQDFADRYPAELGDGMRKRVAIARALTLDPRYVLFDEPTTSLDPVSARRVDKLIRELSDKLGVTSIVVSHDLVSIFSIADRIVMLYKGQVRLLGTPDEFRRATDGVVEQFITGQAQGADGDVSPLAVHGAARCLITQSGHHTGCTARQSESCWIAPVISSARRRRSAPSSTSSDRKG